MVLEFVGSYVGGKLLDWAIPRDIAIFAGTEKERVTRKAFEEAAIDALASVWEESEPPPDTESAQALAEHMSEWLTEPSVAEVMFRAANAKREVDSRLAVDLMEQSGFEVSIAPFAMEDFVTAFVPRLGEVVDREMRSQGLTETVLADKLDELLVRTEPRGSAVRAAISGADGLGRHSVLVGVRSFTRRAEDMDDEMDHLLRLDRHFDGRDIRSAGLWSSAVYPELEAFLEHNLNGHDRYLLHLSAHTTIAFACGFLLDPKSGIDVAPVQRTSGKQEWRPAVDPDEARRGLPGELWKLDPIPLREDGRDLVMALSMTRDVLDDVTAYARENIPTASRILSFEVASGASRHSVRNGTHALLLADDLMARFEDVRSAGERTGTVHLFAAAPAGFMFFAGRFARGLRRCMLYEFDFEGGALGAYVPSLLFPPPLDEGKLKTETRGG